MRKGDDFFRVTFDRKWDDTKIFEKKITCYQNRRHLTRPSAIMEICNRYISDAGTDYSSDIMPVDYMSVSNVGRASSLQEVPEVPEQTVIESENDNYYQNESNQAYENNDSDMPEMDEDAASAIIRDMFGGI